MSSAYYTTLSNRQVKVIEMANSNGFIRITPNMLEYLKNVSERGGGFVRNKNEEDFRSRIRLAVGDILNGAYASAEETIRLAFRILAAVQTSNALNVIKNELTSIREPA